MLVNETRSVKTFNETAILVETRGSVSSKDRDTLVHTCVYTCARRECADDKLASFGIICSRVCVFVCVHEATRIAFCLPYGKIQSRFPCTDAAGQSRRGSRTVSRLQGYPVSRASEPRELPCGAYLIRYSGTRNDRALFVDRFRAVSKIARFPSPLGISSSADGFCRFGRSHSLSRIDPLRLFFLLDTRVHMWQLKFQSCEKQVLLMSLRIYLFN